MAREAAVIHLAEPVEADVLRIRHEFLDLPGLALTVPQAARLVGVAVPHAAAMLALLEREGFLESSLDAREVVVYRRVPLH